MVYTANWVMKISPIPPVKGTGNNHWLWCRPFEERLCKLTSNPQPPYLWVKIASSKKKKICKNRFSGKWMKPPYFFGGFYRLSLWAPFSQSTCWHLVIGWPSSASIVLENAPWFPYHLIYQNQLKASEHKCCKVHEFHWQLWGRSLGGGLKQAAKH